MLLCCGCATSIYGYTRFTDPGLIVWAANGGLDVEGPGSEG